MKTIPAFVTPIEEVELGLGSQAQFVVGGLKNKHTGKNFFIQVVILNPNFLYSFFNKFSTVRLCREGFL
jgi:hypothetical protein